MKQALNFNWQFIPDFKEEYLTKEFGGASLVNIPHTVKEVPYNYFDEKDYQIVSTYEKEFDVEDSISNKTVILRFDAFMLQADIYLNDKKLGHFVSGYIPVEIDVSEVIKQKGNRLVVVLDSKEDKNYPPFGLVVDYLTFSGIYREVSLITHPKTYLKDIFVHGDMDGNVRISYEKVGNSDISVTHQLIDEDQLVLESSENAFSIEKPHLWDINDPYLYILKTTVKSSDGEEMYSTRFGFRNAVFNQYGFFLNNQRVKIRGLNRHQGYPFIGYAAPKSLQEDDANIMKFELGLNTVRTSHYPQSEHFLNRCDEIGLMVVNEIPGWQHLLDNEVWQKQVLINTEAMVKEQRNHPSVIVHGVRIDESLDNHELYTKTNAIAHELDPYRQTIGVRNFKGSELLEDVYGYNDFICNSLKEGLCNPKSVGAYPKGYLVTEYMGHMDPLKPTSDERQKIETALHHMKVINDTYKSDYISGAIGWCFVDYHSHADFGSGDRICAHGVMDLYRNPKYSAYVYASQQDDHPYLELLHTMYPGDHPEAIFNDIYAVTNCDYVELWKDGQFVNKFYPKNDKTFKYIKHPPILIDDIVGETFNEPRFKKKEWKKIASCFSYAAMKGYGHMKLSHLAFLGLMMSKYKLKFDDLVNLFNKYVATWGGEAKTYLYKGYKNGECVASVEKGPCRKFAIRVTKSQDYLHEGDTYDAMRLRIQCVDEHGSIASFANRVVDIKTEGPIKVVGGEHQALLGGQLGLYVLTTGKLGKAKITLKIDDLTENIDLEVK